MTRTFATLPRSRVATLLAAITLAILGLALSPAQDLAAASFERRLLPTRHKYEVKGDRVRYKSAERDEWEELPSSLIDWPATEKYEKGRATSAIPEAKALDKETDAERAAEESHLPQVAPGLRFRRSLAFFCSIPTRASRRS